MFELSGITAIGIIVSIIIFTYAAMAITADYGWGFLGVVAIMWAVPILLAWWSLSASGLLARLD